MKRNWPSSQSSSNPEIVKRPRGRPRKNSNPIKQHVQHIDNIEVAQNDPGKFVTEKFVTSNDNSKSLVIHDLSINSDKEVDSNSKNTSDDILNQQSTSNNNLHISKNNDDKEDKKTPQLSLVGYENLSASKKLVSKQIENEEPILEKSIIPISSPSPSPILSPQSPSPIKNREDEDLSDLSIDDNSNPTICYEGVVPYYLERFIDSTKRNQISMKVVTQKLVYDSKGRVKIFTIHDLSKAYTKSVDDQISVIKLSDDDEDDGNSSSTLDDTTITLSSSKDSSTE